MNITGNHDIGYAGELNEERLERWEEHFGQSNYVHTLSIPSLPPLRIVLFNTLNLDSPATAKDLQNKTHAFLQSLLPDDDIAIPQTVLLTHLPLYRAEGICSDPPRFDYWTLNISDSTGNVTGYFRPIKHQNHLSRWASDWILETMFGEHDEGIILGGHDHEGCDVLHRRREDDEEYSWMHDGFTHDELKRRKRSQEQATLQEDEAVMNDESVGQTTANANGQRNFEGVEIAGEENFDHDEDYGEARHPLEISQYAAHQRNNVSEGIWKAQKFTHGTSGIREITVRSMMGDFHGNVGLLTGSYNQHTHRTLPPSFSLTFLCLGFADGSSVGIRVLDLYLCSATLVVASPYLGYHLHYLGGGIFDPSTVGTTLGVEGPTCVGEDVGES
jgi:hypothetical protein